MPKIEMNKKYKTRSGLPVRILCTDAEGPYPVIALLRLGENLDVCYSFTEIGLHDMEHPDSPYDLVEIQNNDPDVAKSFEQGEIILVSDDNEEYVEQEFLVYDKARNQVWTKKETSIAAYGWVNWKPLKV